jgi:hypothetical protein
MISAAQGQRATGAAVGKAAAAVERYQERIFGAEPIAQLLLAAARYISLDGRASGVRTGLDL